MVGKQDEGHCQEHQTLGLRGYWLTLGSVCLNSNMFILAVGCYMITGLLQRE